MIYSIFEIKNDPINYDGKTWQLCKPENYKFKNYNNKFGLLFLRLKAAWLIIRGKGCVIKWL
jgi:hypothetical protein